MAPCYPTDLRDEIDTLRVRIDETANDGVYMAGFATSQKAYKDAVGHFFELLD